MTGNIWPVSPEDGLAIGIGLDELDGSHPGSLESETESADSAEKVEDTHVTPLDRQ